MLDIYWSLVIPLAIIIVFDISLFVLIKTQVIQRLKLTKNVITIMLVVTLVPILCIGFVSNRKMSSVISHNISEKLFSVGDTRANFLNERLEEIQIDTESLAKYSVIVDVLRKISLEKTGKSDPLFTVLLKNVQNDIEQFRSLHGYEDVMLVSAEGKIEVAGTKDKDGIGLDISKERYFQQGKKGTYTSHGHKLRFFKELKTQG